MVSVWSAGMATIAVANSPLQAGSRYVSANPSDELLHQLSAKQVTVFEDSARFQDAIWQ
jgi:hypothetical protein